MHRGQATIIFLALLLVYTGKAGWAQSVTFSAGATKVCLGNSITFTATLSGGSVASRIWDFGDGNTDITGTSLQVTHAYTSAGNYTVQLTVQLTAGGSVSYTLPIQIKVVDLPKARLLLLTDDSACIADNVCVRDQSTVGGSGAPIRKRTFIFGDGFLITLIAGSNYCHQYALTGKFKITLEIEDTNGCTSSDSLYITIGPRFSVGFSQVGSPCCPYTFTNTGNLTQANVKRFYWDFGDGTFDSINFNQASKSYAASGPCPVKVTLYVQNNFGCWDTSSSTFCPRASVAADIQRTVINSCFRTNSFQFSIPPVPGASISWGYAPLGSLAFSCGGCSSGGMSSIVNIKFPGCGKYVVQVLVQSGCCMITDRDTVEVSGPVALIDEEIKYVKATNLKNKYQCGAVDTVYFVSPGPYLSTHCDARVRRVWDFGDAFCLPCTTDTRNGINVNQNCRYSLDSIQVKHFYIRDTCYSVKLTLTDTLTGCSDSATTLVNLQKPVSKFEVIGKRCYGNQLFFDLSKLEPRCAVDSIFFYADSRLGFSNPVMITTSNRFHTYSRTSAGMPPDTVVPAIVVKSGNCYDTSYVTLLFNDLDAGFFTSTTAGCPPFPVTFTPIFPVNKSITRVVWNFGDGTVLFQNTLNGDTILPQTHNYTTKGSFNVSLILFDTTGKAVGDTLGCQFFSSSRIFSGMQPEFSYPPRWCAGRHDTLWNFTQNNDPTNPPNTLTYLWDFGDGDTSGNFDPIHTFTKAGKYKVKLVVTDRNGCKDSITHELIVNGVLANFNYKPDTIICDQVVQFFDSSLVIDSTGVLPRDSIVSFYWTLDNLDSNARSVLKNPANPYTVFGPHQVKLKVRTLWGCEDSIVKSIFIDGPQPQFAFRSDTFICVGTRVLMENNSQKCRTNIIRIERRSDKKTFSFPIDTAHDTFGFVFADTGTFDIYLFGNDTLINPATGNLKYCSSWYPLLTAGFAQRKTVEVYPYPEARFTAPDTVCPGETVVFENFSDPYYNRFHWDFGDGDTAFYLRPDTNATHVFQDSGTYTIRLQPSYLANAQRQKVCTRDYSRNIYVQYIKARFDLDSSNTPIFQFLNRSSTNAIKYNWDFGHPQSGNKNLSTDENPFHDYATNNGPHIVCLQVESSAGCKDTWCDTIISDYKKWIRIPNVFTANADGTNDAFDIDIEGENLYQLSVYNRWGEEVYHNETDGNSNDGNNWNGSKDNTGPELPEGLYFYVFKCRFKDEQEIRMFRGDVTLIR